jgi:hypothetical protein
MWRKQIINLSFSEIVVYVTSSLDCGLLEKQIVRTTYWTGESAELRETALARYFSICGSSLWHFVCYLS